MTLLPLRCRKISPSHIVVLPSYNTGSALLERTVREALRYWPNVWVFIDGSTDHSDTNLHKHLPELPGLRIFTSKKNRGKGATTLWAAETAAAAGATHLLLMDADGQHPADAIPAFMQISSENPGAMILGQPHFGDDAPWIRLAGRQLTIVLTHLETLWGGIGDTLFGFRVYPIAPLCQVFSETKRGARRYDFDPEVAVRLFWNGVRPIRRTVPVRYLGPEENGVSHFHYLRDNLRMIALHTRLLPQALLRLPSIAQHRKKWGAMERRETSAL